MFTVVKLLHFAIENCLFMVDLPIKNGGFSVENGDL